MKNNKLISETTLKAACEYLQSQFDAHSWWPKAQPGKAEQEYQLMSGSAEALNVWCDRWLDSGQKKQLDKSLRNKS